MKSANRLAGEWGDKRLLRRRRIPQLIFRTPEQGPLPVIIGVTNDAGTGDTGQIERTFTVTPLPKPQIERIDTGRNFVGVEAGMVNGVQHGIFFNGAPAINLTPGLDFERLLTEVPQNAPLGPGRITVGGQGGVGESDMAFVVTTATSPSIRGDYPMADNGDIAPQIGIDATKLIVAGRTAVFKRRITAKPGEFVTISVIPLQAIPAGTLIDFPRQLTIDGSGKALYEIKVITPVKTLAGNYDYQRETRFFDNGVEVDRDIDILRVVIKPPSVTILLAPSQPSPAPLTAGKQDQLKIRVQRKDFLGSIKIVGSNLRGPSSALFVQPADIPVSNSPDATEIAVLDVFSIAPRPGDDGTLPGSYRLTLSAAGEVPLGGSPLDVSFQVSIKPDVQIELRPAELNVDTGTAGKFNVNIFRYNVPQAFMPQVSGLPPEFNPKLGTPQVNQLPVGDRTIIPFDFFVPSDAEAREYVISAEVIFDGRIVRDRAKLMVPRPELEIAVAPNSDTQTLVLTGGQKQTFEITAKRIHFDALATGAAAASLSFRRERKRREGNVSLDSRQPIEQSRRHRRALSLRGWSRYRWKASKLLAPQGWEAPYPVAGEYPVFGEPSLLHLECIGDVGESAGNRLFVEGLEIVNLHNRARLIDIRDREWKRRIFHPESSSLGFWHHEKHAAVRGEILAKH
ncbi:MAG TPA: hypothetical protein VIS96_18795 [Terrimicrobiaceae bacterium]